MFFYGVSLISDAADPPVCIGFGGTFFNINNFAELLCHKQVTSLLLTFQGHWRLPPVHDTQVYVNGLNDWYTAPTTT